MKTKKKNLRRKSELISGKPNRRRFWFRTTFYLQQNGKPFHEEINHAEKPCGPHKTASCGHSHGLGSPALQYLKLRMLVVKLCLHRKRISAWLEPKISSWAHEFTSNADWVLNLALQLCGLHLKVRCSFIRTNVAAIMALQSMNASQFSFWIMLLGFHEFRFSKIVNCSIFVRFLLVLSFSDSIILSYRVSAWASYLFFGPNWTSKELVLTQSQSAL